jgi:hypothetical protein
MGLQATEAKSWNKYKHATKDLPTSSPTYQKQEEKAWAVLTNELKIIKRRKVRSAA